MSFLGDLVSGAASFFGAQKQSDAIKENNAANIAAQQQINAQNIAEQRRAQEIASSQFAEQMGYSREQFAEQKYRADQNIDLQKEFAQSGLRWKVADAVAAGLHPLYALGGSAMSFAPVSVGGTSIPGSSVASAPHLSAALSQADTASGAGLARMGQDVGRAINATRTQDERITAAAMGALGLERASLENDLLRSQIAKNNAGANPPAPSLNPFGIDGQTQSGSKVTADTFKRIEGLPGQPGSEPAAITDVGYSRTATGWAPVPSKDVKERIEDNWVQEVLHAIRNNVMPTIGINRQPPPFPPPAGQSWVYNPFQQEYQLRDHGSTFSRMRQNFSRGSNYGR